WLPLDEEWAVRTSRTSGNFSSVARLAPGVSLAQASSELSGLSRNLKTRFGDDTVMVDSLVIPLLDVMTTSSRSSLQILLGASLLLLVVATVNVSNMLVARGASRRKQFAVQLALGAGRGRIMRQVLAETFVLCLGGVAIGQVLAMTAVRLFVAMRPPGVPR